MVKITSGKIDASKLGINASGEFDAKVECFFCSFIGWRLQNKIEEIKGRNICQKCIKMIFKT